MNGAYEKDKARQLARLPGLRFANAIGMVAWREGPYSSAEQRLRLIHPLSWLMILIWIVFAAFFEGVPQMVRDLCDSLKRDTVWF